jgi:hypothetical protein
MAHTEMKAPTTGAAMPHWRAPQVLLTAAVRSSSLLGHDLINRFRAERYELFLSGHFALWASAGVVLPLLEYVFWYRTPYVLLFAAIGTPQCVALAIGLRLARLGRYSQSISLVCITNWISAVLVTVVNPNFLPVMALVALVPVVFAELYIAGNGGWPALSSPRSACWRWLCWHVCFRFRRWSNTGLAGSRRSSSLWACRSTLFTS